MLVILFTLIIIFSSFIFNNLSDHIYKRVMQIVAFALWISSLQFFVFPRTSMLPFEWSIEIDHITQYITLYTWQPQSNILIILSSSTLFIITMIMKQIGRQFIPTLGLIFFSILIIVYASGFLQIILGISLYSLFTLLAISLEGKEGRQFIKHFYVFNYLAIFFLLFSFVLYPVNMFIGTTMPVINLYAGVFLLVGCTCYILATYYIIADSSYINLPTHMLFVLELFQQVLVLTFVGYLLPFLTLLPNLSLALLIIGVFLLWSLGYFTLRQYNLYKLILLISNGFMALLLIMLYIHPSAYVPLVYILGILLIAINLFGYVFVTTIGGQNSERLFNQLYATLPNLFALWIILLTFIGIILTGIIPIYLITHTHTPLLLWEILTINYVYFGFILGFITHRLFFYRTVTAPKKMIDIMWQNWLKIGSLIILACIFFYLHFRPFQYNMTLFVYWFINMLIFIIAILIGFFWLSKIHLTPLTRHWKIINIIPNTLTWLVNKVYFVPNIKIEKKQNTKHFLSLSVKENASMLLLAVLLLVIILLFWINE